MFGFAEGIAIELDMRHEMARGAYSDGVMLRGILPTTGLAGLRLAILTTFTWKIRQSIGSAQVGGLTRGDRRLPPISKKFGKPRMRTSTIAR